MNYRKLDVFHIIQLVVGVIGYSFLLSLTVALFLNVISNGKFEIPNHLVEFVSFVDRFDVAREDNYYAEGIPYLDKLVISFSVFIGGVIMYFLKRANKIPLVEVNPTFDRVSTYVLYLASMIGGMTILAYIFQLMLF